MKKIYIIFSSIFLLSACTASRPQLSAPTPKIETPEFYILVGDTGSGTPAQTKVAQSIKNTCDKLKNCKAVFILGDVFYEDGVSSVDDPLFQTRFEQTYQDIALPFYIMYGNHDYLGCKKCDIDYTSLSEKWHMPAAYYTYSEPTNIDFFMTDTEAFNAAQQKWLDQSLAQSQKHWKVVLGHRPLVSFEESKINERWTGIVQFKSSVCKYAELNISGHAHALEENSIENCPAKQLISGGGGANLRKIIPSEHSAFGSSSHGFIALEVTDNKLIAHFIDDEGTELHTVTLTH